MEGQTTPVVRVWCGDTPQQDMADIYFLDQRSFAPIDGGESRIIRPCGAWLLPLFIYPMSFYRLGPSGPTKKIVFRPRLSFPFFIDDVGPLKFATAAISGLFGRALEPAGLHIVFVDLLLPDVEEQSDQPPEDQPHPVSPSQLQAILDAAKNAVSAPEHRTLVDKNVTFMTWMSIASLLAKTHSSSKRTITIFSFGTRCSSGMLRARVPDHVVEFYLLHWFAPVAS